MNSHYKTSHRAKQALDEAFEPENPPVCTRYARCEGCSYPRHGLLCWHSDGTCLRTDMEKIENRNGGGMNRESKEHPV